MTNHNPYHMTPLTRALSIITLLLSGVCLALAIYFSLGLFIPGEPYPRFCLHWFFMDLAGVLCFYILHRVIRRHG